MLMNCKTPIKRGAALCLSALLLLSAAGCGSQTADDTEARTGNVTEVKESAEIQVFSSTPAIPDSKEWLESASGASIRPLFRRSN